MPSKVAGASAVFTRLRKRDVLGPICMMDWLSGCGKHEFDEARNGRKFRIGLCASDYQTLYNERIAGRIRLEEAEAAGMCRPSKRQLQKRILRTILARRSA